MNAASQGDTALANSDSLGALQHYTRALTELPRAPTYYIKRSTAYIRYKPQGAGPNISHALRDAEIALTLARERAKRDLILAAQMRRAVALYSLERYGDAGFLFGLLEEKVLSKEKEGGDTADKVKDVMSGSKASGPAKGLAHELQIWLIKIKAKLGGLEEGDERRKIGIEEVPGGVKVPSEKELKRQLEALKAGNVDGVDEKSGAGVNGSSKKADGANAEVPKENKASAPIFSAPVQTPEKIRHEWYQSNDSVVVTLYAKGIAKESVDSELKSDSVSIQFPLPSGAEYAFNLDPLYAPIDESTSKLTVFSTKIELVLRKKTPGQKWSSLESTSTDVKPSITTTTTTTTSTPAPPAPASAPSYPTSSRHGVKDWDKVASTLTVKKTRKPHSHSKDKAGVKKDGDDAETDDSDNEGSVDSEYGGDPVDGFFKKLYAGADDETRRAMVKSFVESNGTSLSTNWSEVGKGEVKPYESKD
ncbi:co-chaperone SGT1 [Aspergillus undulatus]|uniref:co-chaperone SGT1 n=1 Tax=Aspergillus undulatus TaxID=1810928 RepID=UPI003CCE45EF